MNEKQKNKLWCRTLRTRALKPRIESNQLPTTG
jgi:hypothetical protein